MVIERLNRFPCPLSSSSPSRFMFSIYETQTGVIVTKFFLSLERRPRSSRRKRIFYNGQNSRPIYGDFIFLLFLFRSTHALVSTSFAGREEGNKIFREDRTRMIRFGKTGGEEKFFIFTKKQNVFFLVSPFSRSDNCTHNLC